jgi:uncharacterized protein YdeI (YjbR/CyaY-like superfamily)
MKMEKSVDNYILQSGPWMNTLLELRELILSAGFDETVKWGIPVYCMDNKNLIGMAHFKSHAGLWFFQGIFLNDKDAILVSGTEGQTKAQRQLRLYPNEKLKTTLIKRFIKETVANHKAGLHLVKAKPKETILPEELKKALKQNKEAQKKFASLAPYKQREFADYIAQAKRLETREARLEKILPMIEEGRGLNDKFS